MTIAELESALRAAINTGKIGTPVALRLLMQLPQEAADLGGWLSRLVENFVQTLEDPPRQLLANVATGRQWNVLLTGRRGRTASITLGCGSSAHAMIQLTLFGNHGVVDLQGDPLEEEPAPYPADALQWREWVETSAQSQLAVCLPLA